MKHLIDTIRAAIELATPHYQADTERFKQALTALSELERMAGKPVAWKHDCAALLANDVELWIDNCPHCGRPRAAPPAQQQYEAGDMASAHNDGFRAGVASVAQHPQARPDFADEWTGYLKDGETPFERFLRERKDVQSALKLYQRALEENERLKAQQPQADTERCIKARNDLNAILHGEGALIDSLEEAVEGVRRKLAQQPQAEPTDSMGIPLSCGKPLCSPGDHHPLCRLHKQPQAEAVPMTHMQIVTLWGHRSDGPSTPEIVSFARLVEHHHGIVGKEGA